MGAINWAAAAAIVVAAIVCAIYVDPLVGAAAATAALAKP